MSVSKTMSSLSWSPSSAKLRSWGHLQIGGGGQAGIYRAIYNGKVLDDYLLKVFRNEYYLADLQRSWKKNIAATTLSWKFVINNSCITEHGTLLQDGRFAFILKLCWGDLRSAIDLAILKDKTYQSSPIPGMKLLHDRGILHKDLKGENCLLSNNLKWLLVLGSLCMVADFDSPEGVIGTGFWRAPEILLGLKNRVRDLSSHPGVWTKKVDVYSYAMTCYEILRGCIPFEGRATNDYDGVICGERPSLPDYVDLELRELVTICRQSEPLLTPTFKEIVNKLWRISPKFN
ncbi:hypothetical protein M758_9G019800 [Ceratodon purpureus]|nr:hypothetical protein M758_9G019800 [Ceratodon purpureus]